MSDADGELTGQRNGQPGPVDCYEIQCTTAAPLQPGPTWHHADPAKRSTFDMQGLGSGPRSWPALRAVNSTGKSGGSGIRGAYAMQPSVRPEGPP